MTLRRAQTLVAVVLVARVIFHVVYLPAFEGPDEPFHLDRILPHPSGAGMLTGGVADAIRRIPCGPDLSRSFQCPAYAGNGAFNVLRVKTNHDYRPTSIDNYEMHQPPLFYFVALPFGRLNVSVETLLLILRLFSAGLTAAGVVVLMKTLRTDEARLGALLILLLPGATEALIRASNDALLFLWTAVAMANRSCHLEARSARGDITPSVLVAAAAGPLVKLTAFPVSAVIVATSWLNRRRGFAIACALASLSVVAVQMARGWAWGGTYEMNRAAGSIDEPLTESVIGLGRSLYTFAKTTFWVGGWSFFRAPLWLVVVFFSLIAASILMSRFRSNVVHTLLIVHGVGAIVAIGGFFSLAVLNRKLFGTWGGLGGWYFWGWFPWLAVAVEKIFEPRVKPRFLMLAWLGFVLIANAMWFRAAAALYGGLW